VGYNSAVRIEQTPPGWQRERVSPAYIVGPVVTLRHVSLGFTRDEILRQFSWGQDEELQFWSGSVPTAPSVAQFEADIASWLHQRDARRDRYAIIDPAGGLLGMVSYYNVNFERRQAELGIYIGDRAFWSKGIGTEAILTLLSHLFRNTNLGAMVLTTYASNARAQACYRKCGFEVTGTMRKFSGRIGYYVDVQMKTTREAFNALYGERPLTTCAR
jgi:RimJ/RimL family protein N-acetyltransferase